MISSSFTNKRNNERGRLFSLVLSLFFLVQTSSVFLLSVTASEVFAESTADAYTSIEEWAEKANSSSNDLYAESQITENCLDDDECEFLFFGLSLKEKCSVSALYNSHLNTKRFPGTTSLSRGPPQA